MSTPQLEFSPLLDWVEGRLSPQASRDIELLLAGTDDATREIVTWLRHFHAARHAVRLADPPPEVHARLRAQFATYAASRKAGLREHVVAALGFDSLSRPVVAFGARAVGDASIQHRQLVFSCAVADIALNVHRRPHDEQIVLSGQIFPYGSIDPAGWGVLLIGDRGPDATRSDDLGEFAFQDVPPGDYTLTLETQDLAITMPVVSLAP